MAVTHILPTNENTIWIVSGAKGCREGEVCAAFTSYDNANKFLEDYEGSHVMGVELDQWKMVIEEGYRMWEGIIKLSDGAASVWEEKYFFHAPDLDDLDDIFREVQTQKDRICFYCWAKNEEEAIDKAIKLRESVLIREASLGNE